MGTGGDDVEILTVCLQRFGHLIRQLPSGDTVIRFGLCDMVVCFFPKTAGKPQFLLHHAADDVGFLDLIFDAQNTPPLLPIEEPALICYTISVSKMVTFF